MSRNWRLALSLALSLMVGLLGSAAQAEPITMTITTSSGSINVDLFAIAGNNSYNVDAAGLAAINAQLTALGSEYQFFGLSGSSNWAGNSAQGQLVATGEIHSVVGGGSDSFLQITESETNFTSPTGDTGALQSSSTGNFTNQPSGGGHTASSAYNSTPTSTYSVLSTGTPPNGQGNGATLGLAPVTTLYTLTNTITFGLAGAGANDVVDSFGVTATLLASGPRTIPEPASVVMLSMGMPVALVFATWLRRQSRAKPRS